MSRQIGATTEMLTHKVIYYASDYPHWDTEFPENIEHLGRRKDLNDEAKKWLFAETAKQLYGFPECESGGETKDLHYRVRCDIKSPKSCCARPALNWCWEAARRISVIFAMNVRS